MAGGQRLVWRERVEVEITILLYKSNGAMTLQSWRSSQCLRFLTWKRGNGTLVPSPEIDTTALLSPYGAAAYALTDRLAAEVQMRTWKTKHPFDWGLAIRISLLILAAMAVLCMLLYSNYTYTR